MNKNFFIPVAILAAGLALAGCSNLGSSTAPMANDVPTYRAFAPTTEAEVAEAAADGEVNAGYVIVKATKDFDAARFATLGAQKVDSFEFNGYEYYRLYKKDASVRLIADLGRTAGVIYAEHELKSSIPENESPSASVIDRGMSRDAATIRSAFPDDPETWGRFGHFETTGAIDAYAAHGVGSNTIYVVDIDTGINSAHEDFHTADGSSIVAYARSAFDQSGNFVGSGSNFLTVPDESNWDDEAHGSHTAGTIAAVGNNGVGVAGVCWANVRLISYKCFSNSSASSGSDWAVYGGFQDLIAWKKANGITQTIPVNMSLGGGYSGQFELEMINAALDNDIVVIASMGNDGFNRAQYPAAYSGVIAVGAVKADGTKVSFSTMGNYISVMAPGYNIYSTDNNGPDGYEDMSGTSMAAPFVTGTVAYLLTFNPNLKPDQIKTILESTATDMGDAGYDEDTGYGIVNVSAAADLVDGGSIPASGSVYSTKTIKVSVVNGNSHYDSGIADHPQAVVGQTVYVNDSTGTYVCNGLTNGTDGSVEFKLLKPGYYTARVNYGGTTIQKSFTVDNVSDKSLIFSFDVSTVLIQTVPNLYWSDGASTGADTIITLFDAEGTVVGGPYDKGSLDTLTVNNLTPGAAYYILVEPYNTNYGEYALDVGFQAITSANVAPDPIRAENSSDPWNKDGTDPSLIDFDTPVSAYLEEGGEWFVFVMPTN